jgi:AraC-like DNA-binding protein
VPNASKNRVEGTASISGSMTRAIVMGFRKLGLPLQRLSAAAGMTPSELMAPPARVPAATFWSLWREAERLSGDPSLGLHLAQAVPLAAQAGLVGQLAAVSETGLDALRNIARYSRIISDRLRGDLREHGSTLIVEFRLDGVGDATARHVYEGIVAGSWRLLTETIVGDLPPAAVSLRHPPPPDVAPYEQFFGCPVEFRAASYELRLPLELLRQPMVAAQPRAESRLQDLLESELRTLAPELTVAVAEQVRAALEEHERPTQASIARRLGVGQRTLQRRLHDEGSSFRKIVDREHRELALALLGQPGRRVIDVAQAAGFDDATSFAKAFRRWTGESPSAYRARVLDRKA